jgi:predicted AAA+ superfamily ATPase
MYTRIANLSKSHSFFIFGARGTGKSTLLKQKYSKEKSIWLDLLIPSEEEKYLLAPELLREKYLAISENERPKLVIIDEVQKVPKILDVVHSMMEEFSLQFVLTGSSARKLKIGGANLLAGRAFEYALYPLSIFELGDDFRLEESLSLGLLPGLFSMEDQEDKRDFLRSYVQKYIKEEIQMEQLVRDIVPFRKFLDVAAQANAEIINYSKLGRSCGVDYKSVSRYFEILSDTFLGFFLDSYSKSMRVRQIESPKFYFFDSGVVRAITNQLTVVLEPSSYQYGKLFETFIIMECVKLNRYLKKDFRFSYLKTKDGAEIDLIIERPDGHHYLIEIKSAKNIVADDWRHLKSFMRDFRNFTPMILSQSKDNRVVDEIQIFNFRDGLKKIFLEE